MKVWHVVAAIASLISATAHGVTITYQFTADVSVSTGVPTPGSLVDITRDFSQISGTFSFDTDALEITSAGSPAGSTSYDTGSLAVDQFALLPFTLRTSVGNDVGTVTQLDNFGIFSLLPSSTGGQQFGINLSSTNLSLFDGSLPTALLSLSDFDNQAVVFFFDSTNSGGAFQVYNITSLTPVPIPAAAVLFVTALGLLGFVRKWRHTYLYPS